LKADLFPTSGRGDWKHLVLPALTLGAFAMASIARLTRSAVLEVLGADYIRTARAKGVSEMWVVAKHTLKNAAIPIVTITGLQFGTLLGGAVVTETVFSWPGIGRLAVQSINNRDYPVVQCTVFVAALLFIVINFVVDVLYGFLDPRIRTH
jgi:ABC-type dipeptide/oligopeptide/nickel transport system permease component